MVRNPQIPFVRRLLSLLSVSLRGMTSEVKLKRELLATDTEGSLLETDWAALVELGILKRMEEGFPLVEVHGVEWQGPESLEEAFERFRRG